MKNKNIIFLQVTLKTLYLNDHNWKQSQNCSGWAEVNHVSKTAENKTKHDQDYGETQIQQ